ncbi:hypothetical protein DBY21_02800 [Candidatus Gastranaerophilales bacterium]|nr:MAG: hypothetical protein DBY21_02800 [Candidatus Gastranaerophilales bacterium]
MNKITKAELARRFNVNQSRINALLSEKKIFETDDGLIDLDDLRNQAYIEKRKETVPKYTGIPTREELLDEDDIEDKELIRRPGTLKEDPLYSEKVKKYQKENELLDLKLATAKKEVVETEVLNKIIIQSYEIFHNLLLEAPTQIIDEIRDLILTGQHQDDIDLKLLVSKNEEIYKNGLEQARKALKRFYDS